MTSERRTAHFWVVSTHPDAVAWRKNAAGGAFAEMCNRALSDHEKGTIFGQPHTQIHEVIENPSTQPAGKFFTVPESQPVKRGAYFQVPEGA